jgi:UDP-N-acetylglucosamine 2-epimerase (non-hydrolysing)
MKIMTLFGTRPEIIRLSRIIPVLDRFCDQILVHTGQNYALTLSDIFFQELDIRMPDVYLGVKAPGFAEQIGQIVTEAGELLERMRPDRLLILGDTNSALVAIVAARMGIPVYHLEAGNRCYDDRVPEEINRRIIDHCSTVLMPYTRRSAENLVREGIERQRIYVVGNPINEVLQHYRGAIIGSNIMRRLELKSQQFFLATLHRAENVDNARRLKKLLAGLCLVAEEQSLPLIASVHPRTASKIKEFGLEIASELVRLVQPMGLFDFVRLEQEALCVLTDSGTVQEECCILGVPNATLRDTTERPETIEAGSNILTGVEPEDIKKAVDVVLTMPWIWRPPAEYLVKKVSRTVAKIMLGKERGTV